MLSTGADVEVQTAEWGSLLTPKACDGQVAGTTALSIDELQWWKRNVSVHSFIHSLLSPLLLLPETLAEVLRLSEKV